MHALSLEPITEKRNMNTLFTPPVKHNQNNLGGYNRIQIYK